MKEAICFSAIVAAAMCMASTATAQAPVGTTFTYQGRLKDGGGPANGPYDMHFRLYDAATDGAQLGPIICYNNASVADGLFMVALDFGDHFTGQERFLEVAIRVDAGQNCANTSGFTTLSPRQKITAAPNALNADRLDGLDSTVFLQSIPMPLTLSGDNPTSHTIRGENSATTGNSYGVYGRSTATTGSTYGVFGRTDSTGGAGVGGYASSQTGSTVAIWGTTSSPDGRGVYGDAVESTGVTTGVWGRSNSTSGRGVFGHATATSGVTYGGRFESSSSGGFGVFGEATATSGTTHGVYGRSASTGGRGVFGYASAGTGLAYGVQGESASTSGVGVYGYASAATGNAYGLHGLSNSATGCGVRGIGNASSGDNFGVWGSTQSPEGTGVAGIAYALGGETSGVSGQSNSPSGVGVRGVSSTALGSGIGGYFESYSPSGRGVYGRARATTGDARGVYGVTDSTSGLGVVGYATPTTGTTYGVYGQSDSSAGFAGYFVGKGSDALYVRNDANGRGIQVIAANDTGLWASTTAGIAGVDGRNASTTGRGVYGYATAASGENYGVYGRTSSTSGRGVYGWASASSGSIYGVYGQASTAAAGYAVYANGDMGASGAKPFRIDHPFDPENKYLMHYATESPEVLNFYSGKVTLDDAGEAVVELPAYFASINKDPRYTLTAVGAPMPSLHVVTEISEEALAVGEQAGPGVVPPICWFRIAGGAPGGKASWRVEALRNDLRMRLHGAPVEREKAGPERGKYQHPEYYGQPPEMGMDYQVDREARVTGASDGEGR